MAASNNHRLTVTVKPNSGHTLFRYTAKDIDGKVVRGAMEAADYDTLYTQLLAQGLYLQSATRRGAGRKPRTLRPQELSDLCRQLFLLFLHRLGILLCLIQIVLLPFQIFLCIFHLLKLLQSLTNPLRYPTVHTVFLSIRFSCFFFQLCAFFSLLYQLRQPLFQIFQFCLCLFYGFLISLNQFKTVKNLPCITDYPYLLFQSLHLSGVLFALQIGRAHV